MSENELSHLVKMANQITANIGIGASEEDAVARVVKHISMFWARPMREKICNNLETVSEELNPLTLKALTQISGQL